MSNTTKRFEIETKDLGYRARTLHSFLGPVFTRLAADKYAEAREAERALHLAILCLDGDFRAAEEVLNTIRDFVSDQADAERETVERERQMDLDAWEKDR